LLLTNRIGRNGYWPLDPETNSDGTLKPGYEDCEGIEICHSFFEPHLAAGVQDAAGKDARIPMIKAIGFKNTSIYNYEQCYAWSVQNQPAPSANKRREGNFAASGVFRWYALSDGQDSLSHVHDRIDLRRKVYRAVRGTTECMVFWARAFANKVPSVIARRLPCFCINCRSNHENGCLHPELTGLWKRHDVSIKSILTVEQTLAKKRRDKSARKAAQASKAAELRGRSPGAAAAAVPTRVAAENEGDEKTGDDKDGEDDEIEADSFIRRELDAAEYASAEEDNSGSDSESYPEEDQEEGASGSGKRPRK
jgi:hypothetical protein